MKDFEDEVVEELSTSSWMSVAEIASSLHCRRKRKLGDSATKPTEPELYRTLDGLRSACKVEKRERHPGVSEWRKRAMKDKNPLPEFMGGNRSDGHRAYA
jgi:hypothetical protein